jgi:hypothetical protein
MRSSTEPARAATRPRGTVRSAFSANRTDPSWSRSRSSSIVPSCLSVTFERASVATPRVAPTDAVSVMISAITPRIV